MKRLIKLFILILTIIFILIIYIDYKDKHYMDTLKDNIISKTDANSIEYLNVYGDYYIVLDNDNLYVFDKKYIELLKLDRIIIHENPKNYDIIYNEKPMYLEDHYIDNTLYYIYYDIYNYEEIKRLVVGGKHE